MDAGDERRSSCIASGLTSESFTASPEPCFEVFLSVHWADPALEIFLLLPSECWVYMNQYYTYLKEILIKSKDLRRKSIVCRER